MVHIGGTPGRRGTIELYTWPEGKLLRRANPSKDLLYAVTWRSDSKVLATAGASPMSTRASNMWRYCRALAAGPGSA